MALVRNWRAFKADGSLGEIKRVFGAWNLKGCKKILIKFDPFRKDVSEIRKFNYLLFSYNSLKSNPTLIIKTEILCDRSEHTVTVDLINGEKIVMKCTHLEALDIFKLIHEYVTPIAPEETIVNVRQTKIGKRK